MERPGELYGARDAVEARRLESAALSVFVVSGFVESTGIATGMESSTACGMSGIASESRAVVSGGTYTSSPRNLARIKSRRARVIAGWKIGFDDRGCGIVAANSAAWSSLSSDGGTPK